jgi:hypothetical protein
LKETNSNIDSFFQTQLSNFSHEPELQFETLYKVISKEPLDQFLYIQLSTNHAELPPNTWDKINEKNNLIDFGLKEKLLDFEDNSPENRFLFPPLKKDGFSEKWSLLLLFLLFLTITVGYFKIKKYYDWLGEKNNSSIPIAEVKKEKQVENSISNNSKSNQMENNNSVEDVKGLNNKNKSDNNHYFQSFLNSRNQYYSNLSYLEKDKIRNKLREQLMNLAIDEDESNDFPLIALNLAGFQPFQNAFERLEKVNPHKLSKPKLKKSIFQFGIESAYNQMVVNNISINESKIHKDFNGQIINQLTGNHNGISRAYTMDVTIRSKIMISTGLNFSSFTKNTTFQYLHKDITVYDSLGNILGYLQLPLSQQVLINEPLTIKSNRVLIPFVVSYPLYSKNRFSVRLGAGFRYQFNSNIKLSYFDFENSQLNKSKVITKSSLEPLMNAKVLYSLTNQFKIGAHYYWTGNNQSLKLSASNVQYKGFTHGIVLGLYFNPLIKSKK